MKDVFRVVIFDLICIIIFATLYYIDKDGFNDKSNVINMSILDFILLSTTIQASVGISGMYPVGNTSKLLMILQQIIMISTHVFTIYFFNI